MKKFCVYLTIYGGSKLPKFYIGSSSIDKVNSGYVGSVQSKKYGKTFRDELKNHPELFDVIILDEFDTKEYALICELKYQKKLDVIKSNEFMNMALAQPNGFFGMDNSGENHPRYGMKNAKNHKPMLGKRHTDESKIKMRKAKLGKRWSKEHRDKMTGENNPAFGKPAHPNVIKALKGRVGGKNPAAQRVRIVWGDNIEEYFDSVVDFCDKYGYVPENMRKIKERCMRKENYWCKKYDMRIENA